MTDTFELTVPFNGFYCSFADDVFDGTLETMFSDDQGNTDDDAVQKTICVCDWRGVRLEYSKEYVAAMADEIEVESLTFKELNSPREYNFESDVIVATISRNDLAQIIKRTSREALTETCRERHSSRSGFISFYDPDWHAWGAVTTWDRNQLGSLLIVYIATNDFDVIESDLMESAMCNNGIVEMIENHTPGISKIYN